MDIVERLTNIQYDEPLYIIMEDAAKEIKRLRKALKKVELRSGELHIVKIARSALQQKDGDR